MNKDTLSICNRQSLNGPNLTSNVNNNNNNNNSNNYEKDLKVDKRILEIMRSGGNHIFPSAVDFFGRIIDQTNSKIDFSSTFKDRQGNEIPIVKVMNTNLKSLEAASALIMEYLDPHRDKMTFNIDVPYNDHSYIIGKDGSRIKNLSRETGCHIHLPDCNKTSGKKSNKLSIAGTSFESIEQARNQIRRSLPLNVGFKARIKSRKFVHIDTSSSEVQAIKRKYRVDVTFNNVVSNSRYTEVTINVKGGRFQLEEIKCATQELYQFVTGEEIYSNPMLDFTILIDVSHSHHQYVKGKNNCNLKVIHQRSHSIISFPPSDVEVNQVIIQGKDLISTVMGWQELMGYLPLLLSFDVNFDISKMHSEIQLLEKEHGVGIRIREKLCSHVYTVLIKTQERHSICLQEIRQRILALKTKAEKIDKGNIENFCMRDSLYKNLNGSFVQLHANSSNLNQVSKFNPLPFNCNPYNSYNGGDSGSCGYPSTKYSRIQSSENVPYGDVCRSLSSHFNSRRSKVCNKSYSFNNETNGSVGSPNIKNNEPLAYDLAQLNKSNYIPTSKLSALSLMNFDSNDKSVPLKEINVDTNQLISFDQYSTISESVNNNSRCRFSPSDQAKVDYSFSRFAYSNYGENDSDASSKSLSMNSSTMQDDIYMNQENAFQNAFNFYNATNKYSFFSMNN